MTTSGSTEAEVRVGDTAVRGCGVLVQDGDQRKKTETPDDLEAQLRWQSQPSAAIHGDHSEASTFMS